MKTNEDITLFDEVVETDSFIDLADVCETKSEGENAIHFLNDSDNEAQNILQNLSFTNVFLRPYELFLKECARHTFSQIVYRPPF